jgi:hypothetical protein
MTHPPSQCWLPISAPNVAVSGRPLGAIWAGYLFAPNIKAATWQNGWGAQRFDRDQRRSYGASDNLIMDWQPCYLFADIFLHVTPDFGHGRA